MAGEAGKRNLQVIPTRVDQMTNPKFVKVWLGREDLLYVVDLSVQGSESFLYFIWLVECERRSDDIRSLLAFFDSHAVLGEAGR